MQATKAVFCDPTRAGPAAGSASASMSVVLEAGSGFASCPMLLDSTYIIMGNAFQSLVLGAVRPSSHPSGAAARVGFDISRIGLKNRDKKASGKRLGFVGG